MLTSVNHCRNGIFPLLSSLFSGWLLPWESNETFGVRTKVIPIEVFCIADSECGILFTSICCLPEGWPENISQLSDIIYTVHVIFLSSLAGDSGVYRAALLLSFVSCNSYHGGNNLEIFASDCSPVVSLRPLVIPASIPDFGYLNS